MDTNSEAATGALEKASKRDPRTAQFGYFAYDDNSLASVGLFFWFESPRDLLHAIVHLEPFLYDEEPDLARRLDAVIGDPSNHDLKPELLQRVNEAATGDFQVAWWGTFSGLRSEESDWVRELRERFRDALEGGEHEDPSSAAIGDDEVDNFIDFLSEYGM